MCLSALYTTSERKGEQPGVCFSPMERDLLVIRNQISYTQTGAPSGGRTHTGAPVGLKAIKSDISLLIHFTFIIYLSLEWQMWIRVKCYYRHMLHKY